MDTNKNVDANIKPPPLNSDQLNYLIWRYLQESGYGDAAVKLQRDWKVEAEQLPFAKYIKGQALVSLVQKGLRYHHLSLTVDENGRSSKQLDPSMFFFGPATERQASPGLSREAVLRPNVIYRAPSTEISANGVRKHGRESGPNGASDQTQQPSAKRSRKNANNNNVDRNGSIPQQPADDLMAMDVDQVNGHPIQASDAKSLLATDGDFDDTSVSTNGVKLDTRTDVDPNNAGAGVGAFGSRDQERVVKIEPVAPVIYTLTNGESVGIQVAPAKVANLKPSTKILGVAEGCSLNQTLWRPSDPSVLAASGDKFCGLWKVSNSDTLKPPYHSLIDPSDDVIVTSVAWEPGGSLLALATYTTSNQLGQVHIYNGQDLCLMETLPAAQRAITSLRWLPVGLRLVGFAPYDTQFPQSASSSSLVLWDLSGNLDNLGPSSISVPESIHDIDCGNFANSDIICAAGHGVVYECRASRELAIERRWPSPIIEQWTFIKITRGSVDSTIIIAASAYLPHVWIPSKDILLKDVHNGYVTGLQIRPQHSPYSDAPSVHDFATSSMDGTIKVWQYDENLVSVSGLFKVTMGSFSPIMSLSYSPDGFCIAGASYDKVRIWNADQGHQPLAFWDSTDTDWRGSKLKEDDAASNGGASSIEGDQFVSSSDHSLNWDSNSKKMAFGLGTQVAIINFQR